MIEQSVSLASNGVVKVPGYEQLVRFGYTKNRGVYRLAVTATGEWEGLAIRCFWHVPDGKDPASSLVQNGTMDVPASVTAQPGSGCVTFEGSDGTKTVTSADLRYRVSANSGTEDGAMPEPGTPAWQQLVDAVHTDATAAEQAKTDAQTAAQQAADSAGNADQSAQEAADSLQELKDGIASGDFKGEKGDKGDTGPQGPKGDPGPAGADGKDGTQIDDTAVGTDAWSAKHLVDVLCPPISETGNPVVCYPVAGYPLGCKVSWEPTQEGSGDPSPDNVRPIKGRDSVTVERCGENLIDIRADLALYDGNKSFSDSEKRVIKPHVLAVGISGNNYFSEGIIESYTISDGRLHFKTKAPGYGLGVGVILTPGETYSIGFDGDALTLGTINVAYYAEDGTYLSRNENKTFTVPLDAVYSVIVFRGIDEVDADITFENIVLVPGTTAPTAYTPYIGQTSALTLPRTIYGGTVDAVSGSCEKAWNEITLIDTYSWYASTNQYRTFYCVNIKNITRTAIENSEHAKNWKCTHFKSEAYSYAQSGDRDNTVSFQSDRETLVITFPGTIDELKSYLAAQYAAGTPVQIAYKLATPEPFTATGAQPIPALPGVNTLITDADNVTVTGRADPIKRITDLEDTVASMTNT